LTVVSDSLKDFLNGRESISRMDAVRAIWEYGKLKNLINQKDKREVITDERLFNLFKVKKFNYFSINKHLTKHLKHED